MNSLVVSFGAAGFAALSNLFFRKSTENSSESDGSAGYLTLYYCFCFALSLFLHREIWSGQVNVILLSIGTCVGLLNSLLMYLTSRALKKGPSGLTFAFQNASATFPGLILYLVLGTEFGYSLTSLQLLGIALVVTGFFVGTGKETSHSPHTSSWLKTAISCCFIQIAALTLIQARCVLFDSTITSNFVSKLGITEADDIWFMPGQFGASFLTQAVGFFRSNTKLQPNDVMYGSLGGIANFAATGLLLMATKMALPFEKGILFPCFAIAVMLLCNLWAKAFYKERFHLKTNLLCSCGIFLAVS